MEATVPLQFAELKRSSFNETVGQSVNVRSTTRRVKFHSSFICMVFLLSYWFQGVAWFDKITVSKTQRFSVGWSVTRPEEKKVELQPG